MKQVFGLLQKLGSKSTSRWLVHRGKVSLGLSKFDGTVVANRTLDMGDYKCWMEFRDIEAVAKGATLAPDGQGGVSLVSSAGLNRPLTRIDDGDASVRYHDPAEWPQCKVEASFTAFTAAQKQRLLNVLALTSRDQSRYIYGGLHINLSDPADPKFETTDGRVAVRTSALTYGITLYPRANTALPHENVVIPRGPLEVFLKLKVPVTISWNSQLFTISCELEGAEVVYQDKCFEGKFPDIRRVIPEVTHSMRLPYDDILGLPFVKRLPSNPVHFEAQPNGPDPFLWLSQPDDAGNPLVDRSWGTKSDLRNTVKGGFNHAHFTSALKCLADTATIGFKFGTKNAEDGSLVYEDTALSSAIVLRDDETVALVMPMKV